MSFLLVGLGGFFGSIARYSFYLLERSLGLSTFPLATLTVNTLGCFIAGLAITYGEQRFDISHPYALILTVGFLGSFTTFSTFGFENSQMLRNGLQGQMVLNILLNVGLGIGAVMLGRMVLGTGEG